MINPRRLGVAVIASMLAVLSLASTASAAGKVPQGQGLITSLEAGIASLECTDPLITEVIFAGGGGATWTTDGRMYLLQSIDVTGTITTPEGTFPAEFSKTYGNKAGLTGDTVSCTFAQSAPGFEATGTVTVVRVW